jgi:hypothetical protein
MSLISSGRAIWDIGLKCEGFVLDPGWVGREGIW